MRPPAPRPPQADDYEYYLESGDTTFPVTAGSDTPIYETVVIAGEAGWPPDHPRKKTLSGHEH